jgi:hypothetical protein
MLFAFKFFQFTSKTVFSPSIHQNSFAVLNSCLFMYTIWPLCKKYNFSSLLYLISLISLDRVFFYPKQWKSYLPLAFLGILIYSLNSQGVDGAEEVTLIHYINMMLVNALFYAIIWNPISRGGVWKYLKINKNSNKTYKQLEIMVDELKAV